MGKSADVALEAAWEVMALAQLLRRESGRAELDAWVVRGVAARVADVASIIIQLLDDEVETEPILKRLRGE